MATAFISGYEISGKVKPSRRSNVQALESDSGMMRLIDLGQQTYWDIAVVIEWLDETDKDALIDWLEANETTEIALPVGAKTYNGYIDPSRDIAPSPNPSSPNLWEVHFSFKGIKQ